MITSMLLAVAMASGGSAPSALTVMFPDQSNPNFYNVMACRGSVKERTRVRLAKDGSPMPKNGRVLFHCDGPMTTRIQRIPFEPKYSRDTAWAWSFEDNEGKQVMAGYGAKLMMPPADGLSFYVREGYQDP